ncbi:MAG: sugar O-acetyltransferase [Bacteroidales bacterium]|nr:sugar O-acetyltransferase [Bacteroidales bacterium]
MTEKEKMMGGYLYDALNKDLLKELIRGRGLSWEYNRIHPADAEAQRALLEKAIGSLGSGVIIVPPFFFDYGSNISIGNDSFINMDCVILDEALVTIGSNVFIAPQCGFYTAGHALDVKTRNDMKEYALPITIGDNVWIGGGVKVMPGVTIGSGSVIGGGSVVVKDIPEGVLAAGNPCRVIRKITPEDAFKYPVAPEK